MSGLPKDVAIVGIGQYGYSSSIPNMEFREMDFIACSRAYEECGLNPRKDIDSFIHCQEDMWEGTSITSEYSTDQIGGALKPVCTVAGDGLLGVATAYMQIASGIFETVAVVSHGKPSEITDLNKVIDFSLDPVLHRPLGFNPLVLAGIEATRYMEERGIDRQDLDEVIIKNRGNAMLNPRSAYPSKLDRSNVSNAPMIASPLTSYDISWPADGAVALVLTTVKKARELNPKPVLIAGVGWASETVSLESSDAGKARSVSMSAKQAYDRAGIKDPKNEIDIAEIDDTFSYRELIHMESLGICEPDEIKELIRKGETMRDGSIPVNVSGGSLGMGHMLEATGLARLYEAVLQLRGEAGALQVKGVERALVQSWRGIPSSTTVVLVLEVF